MPGPIEERLRKQMQSRQLRFEPGRRNSSSPLGDQLRSRMNKRTRDPFFVELEQDLTAERSIQSLGQKMAVGLNERADITFRPTVTPEGAGAFRKARTIMGNTLVETGADSVNRWKDFIETTYADRKEGRISKLELSTLLRAATGTVNTIFSPVSGAFAAAEEIPIIRTPAKALNWVFEKIGAAGAWTGTKIIDSLPIDDETKAIFRGPVAEAMAIGAQFAVAKVGHKVGQKINIRERLKPALELEKVIAKKVKAKIKGRKKITPDEAKRIVNESLKEVELPPAEAIARVKTPTDVIEIATDQKLILENFIKGEEKLDFKKVQNLGKDTNGNSIRSRFEWDYKKQRGTILTSDKTTGVQLAHEIGHFLDRKTTSVVGDKLSSVIPDYLGNKEAVDGALTSFAVDRLKGDATSKQIQTEIKRLANNFNTDIVKLSKEIGETRTGFNEQFASAVGKVIEDPAGARNIAPDFTAFTRFNMRGSGVFARKTKAAAGVAEAELVKAAETAPKTAAKKTPAEKAKVIPKETKKAPVTAKTKAIRRGKPSEKPLKPAVKAKKRPVKSKRRFARKGKSSAEQESIVAEDRVFYHGLSGRRLSQFEKTGKIPKASQAFGGDFSITDDFGLAKLHAGKGGKVVEVKIKKGTTVETGKPGEVLGDITDIGEGEFIVTGSSVIDLPGQIKKVSAKKKVDKTKTEREAKLFVMDAVEQSTLVGKKGRAIEIKLPSREVQKLFEKTLPNKPVTLYRGIKKEGTGAELSSWSRSRVIAEGFAEGGKVISKKFKPAELLLDVENYYKAELGKPLFDKYSKYVADLQKGKKVPKMEDLFTDKEIGTIRQLNEFAVEKGVFEQEVIVKSPGEKISAKKKISRGIRVLEEIRKEARTQAKIKDIPAPKRLIEEAKKFDTAEEFVEAQGEPLFHGTSKQFDAFDNKFVNTGKGSNVDGIWFTSNKTQAEAISEGQADIAKITRGEVEKPRIIESFINPSNPKIIDISGEVLLPDKANQIIKIARENGNDVVVFNNVKVTDKINATHTVVLDNNLIKTRDQLTDIFNQAKGQVKQPKKLIPPKASPKQFQITRKTKGRRITTDSFNVKKMNAPEDVLKILDEVAAKNENFANDRRSVTIDEMKDFSRQFLGDESLYTNLPAEMRQNMGKMNAARQTMVDLAGELLEEMRGTDLSKATPEVNVSLREKLYKLELASQSFAGARTEASHIFSSLKAEVTPGENAILRELFQEVGQSGLGKDVPTFLEKFQKSKTRDRLTESKPEAIIGLLYSAVLSGPTTFLKNFTSTAGSVFAEVGAALNKPKQLTKSLPALYQGLADGLGLAKQVAKGTRTFNRGKFFNEGAKFEKIPYHFSGKAEILNKTRIIGRLLGASDIIFNEGLRQMEIAGIKSSGIKVGDLKMLAERRVKAEGWKGEIADLKVKEYMNQPDILIGDAANEFALRGTYNSDPNGTLGVVSKSVSAMTRGAPVLKPVALFTRVVSNVVNVGVDFTPYGYTRIGRKGGLFARISEKFGGKELEIRTVRERQQQMARATLGTAAMAVAFTMAAEGNLTGNGPRNSSKRQQLFDSGWKPNSIKIGETYIPYVNWGPLALPLAIAANATEAYTIEGMRGKDIETRLAASIAGTTATIFDMSFLTGVNRAMEAVAAEDPKAIVRYMANTATLPIPNLVKQLWRWYDPTIYSKNTVLDALAGGIPIINSLVLDPKLNVFGEEVIGDRFYQLQPGQRSKDPLIRFLSDNEIWISIPSKTTLIQTGRTKRQMINDEYREYIKTSGSGIKQRLTRELPRLERLPAKRKEEAVNKIVRQEREKAKKQLQAKLR